MIQPIDSHHGVSLAQLTMAWTIAQRGCSHVLCGARNPKQATDNAGAGDVELSPRDVATITDAVNSYQGV